MNDFNTRELPETLSEVRETSTFQSTVGWTIMNLFPYGTDPDLSQDGKIKLADRNEIGHWSVIPPSVADVFGATAYLLENSGAFGHFTPYEPRNTHPFRNLWIPTDLHKIAITNGQNWQLNAFAPPTLVEKWWEELVSFWDFPLNYRAYRGVPRDSIFAAAGDGFELGWWQLAFLLLVASDEAAEGTGFPPMRKNVSEQNFSHVVWRKHLEKLFETQRADGISKLPELGASICSPAMNSDLLCVQPKVLFPVVGGGTRVFSKNLALLRPRGLVRTQWLNLPQQLKHELDSKLRLMLIPLPFELNATDFSRIDAISPISDDASRAFRLKQSWLEDVENVCAFVISLLNEAKLNKKIPDALIFPELSLNRISFNRISEAAKRICPSLQFIVAGAAQNCDGMSGNFVWTRVFLAQNINGKYRHKSSDGYLDLSQSKHHRWKLDPKQIEIYGLKNDNDDGLNGDVNYWESVNSRGRELGFLPFRNGSVLTSLICEDLARSEPCHEIVRAIGPNLVIALLMDSAQKNARWGARYASVFTEDHGGAVLTLTSYALVKKANKTLSEKQRSNSIAYFRDHNGVEKEIECPNDNSAVFLILSPETINREIPTRSTIDGRKKNSISWKLSEYQVISLP